MAKRLRPRPTEFFPFADDPNSGVNRTVPRGRGGGQTFSTQIEADPLDFSTFDNPALEGAGASLFGSIDETLEETLASIFENRDTGLAGFQTRRSGIEEENPLNPFSDEERLAERTTQFNTISQETQADLNRSLVNFSSRGLGRSSLAFEAGGDLRERGIASRAQTESDLLSRQRLENTSANAARSSLLGNLTAQQTDFLTRILGLETGARTEAAGRKQDIFSDLFTTDFTQDEAERLRLRTESEDDLENFSSSNIDAIAGLASIPGREPLNNAATDLIESWFQQFEGAMFEKQQNVTPAEWASFKGDLAKLARDAVLSGRKLEGDDLSAEFQRLLGSL